MMPYLSQAKCSLGSRTSAFLLNEMKSVKKESVLSSSNNIFLITLFSQAIKKYIISPYIYASCKWTSHKSAYELGIRNYSYSDKK